MIGVPPAAGFVSKWFLAVGSIEAKEIPILMVLLASTILNAAYFLPITYKAFRKRHNHPHPITITMIIMLKFEKTPWLSYKLS